MDDGGCEEDIWIHPINLLRNQVTEKCWTSTLYKAAKWLGAPKKDRLLCQVCASTMEYVLLSHLGNIVMRTGTTTWAQKVSGFSLGILKHASGTLCLAKFGVPEWKICVQVSEYDESSWSYETRAAPIATSELEIRYSLSKLTKRSDKLF